MAVCSKQQWFNDAKTVCTWGLVSTTYNPHVLFRQLVVTKVYLVSSLLPGKMSTLFRLTT